MYCKITVGKDNSGTFAGFYFGDTLQEVMGLSYSYISNMKDWHCFQFSENGEGKTLEDARSNALLKVLKECKKAKIDPAKTVGLRDLLD